MTDEIDIDRLVDHYLGANDQDTDEKGDVKISVQNADKPPLSPLSSRNKYARVSTLPDNDNLSSIESNSAQDDDIEVLVDSILRGERRAPTRAETKTQNPHKGDPEEDNDSDDLSNLLTQQRSRPRETSRGHSQSLPNPPHSPGDRRGAFLQRLMLWQERRDARRLQAVYEALLEEQASCTFHPFRPPSVAEEPEGAAPLAERVGGAHDFLRRMTAARDARQQERLAEEEENRRYTNRSTWNPRVTVPRPFELGRSTRKMAAVRARLNTFQKYGSSIRAQLEEEPSRIEEPSIPGGAFSIPLSQQVLLYARRSTSR